MEEIRMTTRRLLHFGRLIERRRRERLARFDEFVRAEKEQLTKEFYELERMAEEMHRPRKTHHAKRDS